MSRVFKEESAGRGDGTTLTSSSEIARRTIGDVISRKILLDRNTGRKRPVQLLTSSRAAATERNSFCLRDSPARRAGSLQNADTAQRNGSQFGNEISLEFMIVCTIKVIVAIVPHDRTAV